MYFLNVLDTLDQRALPFDEKVTLVLVTEDRGPMDAEAALPAGKSPLHFIQTFGGTNESTRKHLTGKLLK